MIPRARHTDIAAPAKNDVMALSIMTGEATHRTRPANDVKAEDRQNLLVRRRRRFGDPRGQRIGPRREAH